MVRLEKMTANDYQRYLNEAIKTYASEHVKAGNWDEVEAIGKATEEYERLLPEGENTKDHHLFNIMDEKKEVGMIWLGQRTKEKGFIYDINIWEGNQGRGYGKKAMKEIEIVAKTLGMEIVRLHVFGHNKAARGLYEKIGYIKTDLVMEKKI